jgi:hypothetical protein
MGRAWSSLGATGPPHPTIETQPKPYHIHSVIGIGSLLPLTDLLFPTWSKVDRSIRKQPMALWQIKIRGSLGKVWW